MCVIIVKPKTSTLSEDNLRSCYENNPDGMGYMYVEKGRVVAHKFQPDTFEEVKAAFDKLKDIDAVIHFRYLTTGSYSLAHCHPFRVLKKHGGKPDIFMMHNGTFTVSTKAGENDTIAYNNQVLKPILGNNPSLLKDDKFMKMLENMDNWSRLCFMTSDGDTVVTRRDKWITVNGCLLSNDYSLNPNHRTPTTVPPYNKKGHWVKKDDESGWIWIDENDNVTKTITKPKPVTSVAPLRIEYDGDDDILLTQQTLKSMPEEELHKWIEEDPEDVIITLLNCFSHMILLNEMIDMGISYGGSVTETDLDYYISAYPESVVEFIKTGYDAKSLEYTEYFHATN